MELKEGDLIKIDINKVKKHDNMPPYIKLVNAVIRNAKGKPYVSNPKGDIISIRAWKYDYNDVNIPRESVIKVVGNDIDYQLNNDRHNL